MQTQSFDVEEPPQGGAAAWKRYVVRLCRDAWDLEDATTAEVLKKIDALVRARVLTVPAVAMVLERAGVTASEADHIAPSIQVAIRA
ncbi:MAG: hypothetical protein PVH96_08925 [Gemmatimonadota bacterium]